MNLIYTAPFVLFGGINIFELIEELEEHYTGAPDAILWRINGSTIDYFQHGVDNNEVTITNVCNVTYESIEEFIINSIPDLRSNYPELFV